jgi:hypothetical protein
MIDRRSFAALLAGAVATPRTAWSQMTANKAVFYASVGPALTRYQIDVEEAALTRQDTVMLPANVQYAWRHPTASFLYVATSNGGSASLGIKGDKHFLSALRIDSGNGALQTHGPSAHCRRARSTYRSTAAAPTPWRLTTIRAGPPCIGSMRMGRSARK